MIGVFAILLLLKNILSKAAEPASKCTNKNVFMSRLVDSQVTVFDHPKASTSASCSTEWGAYKTCCDIGSLVQYSSKDQKHIMNAVKNVTESMYLISRDIDNTIKLIKDLSKEGLPLNKLLTIYEASYLSEDQDKFRLTQHNVLTNFPQVSSNSEQCWQHITQMRAVSLCGICSGRSQAFFKKDKITVTVDTCSEVMTHCSAHFGVLVKFIKRVSLLIDSLHKEIVNGPHKFSGLILENIRNVSIISNQLKNNRLVHTIHEYFIAIDANHKRECLITVCEKLTNLFSPVLVQRIRPLMAQLEMSTGITYQIAKLHLNELISNRKMFPKVDTAVAIKLKNQYSNTPSSTDPLDLLYSTHLETSRLLVQSHMKSNNSKLRMLTASNYPDFANLIQASQFQGDVNVQIAPAMTFSSVSTSPNSLSAGSVALDLKAMGFLA